MQRSPLQNRVPRGSPGPTWILPVFLPHLGCPHRCVYCNQFLMNRNEAPLPPAEIRRRLEDLLACRKNDRGRRRQIAFFGGNFTGIEAGLQSAYLEAARDFLDRGRVDSLRVSTRPDGISPERLSFLAGRGVETVEIGVQSLCDRVLQESRRGYTARQAVEAILAVKRAGLEAGAQIMVGLPGDTGASSMATVERLGEVRPDFVRIYPLMVFRDTELARWTEDGRYQPWELEAAVSLCSRMLEKLEEASIPVARIGLHLEEWTSGPGESVRAGPGHPAFGFLVRAELFRRRALAALTSLPAPGALVRVRVHPRDRPLLSGYRGQNLREICSSIGAGKMRVEEDDRCRRGWVEWG